MIPHPNDMGMWPQFRSPLMWDVFAVSTYMTTSILFWYMGLVPDLATFRDRCAFLQDGYFYFAFSLKTSASATANTPQNRVSLMRVRAVAGCDGIDFNNNGVFPEDQDVIDFFNVLAGAECSVCNDIDFNNNNVFPEDQDVIDFFNVLAGAECGG